MPSADYRFLRELQGRPLVDKRTGDRHKGKRYRNPDLKKGKPLTKWERRRVVAWDGEGANLSDNTHVYNLLANSDGTYILNHDGLGTEEVFEFFIRFGDPRAINVIFGGSYDVNMLLVDIPVDKLGVLWTTGSVFWKNYRIYYANRKKFTIQKFYKEPGATKYKKFTFVLWDVLGYFQSSFVVACRKWLGNLPVLDEIERMKGERSVFSVDRIDEIIEYNKTECLLLVKLMHALFDALDTADIKLTRYDGAGSIAAALLSKNKVKEHKGEPSEDALLYAQYAYSGGRIEAPKIGVYMGNVQRNDINSAYPSQMLNLPSYAGATWTLDKEWDGSDNSMAHVRWFHTEDRPFYPLWYREHDGTILYPRWGEGIYWGTEVRLLKDYYPGSFEIIDAVNCHLSSDIRPFSFVEQEYATRLMFKLAGNMASEALKLGLNSLYGKLAQQAGYRNGRIPTYHQLLLAGQITAGTRARLFRAAMQHPDNIIAFATDAIMSTVPLDVEIGTGLGQWTHDEFDGITMVQPGVYWLLDKEDGWGEKYRGFDKGSLNRDHIVSSWLLGFDYTAKLTRFVGMGSALMSTRFNEVWRTWPTEARTLGLKPSGKRMESDDTCYWDHLCDTIAATNMNMDVMSMPYPLLWVGGKPEGIRPKIEGIDVRLLEEEYIDSYA